jgi:hypothetical protein
MNKDPETRPNQAFYDSIMRLAGTREDPVQERRALFAFGTRLHRLLGPWEKAGELHWVRRDVTGRVQGHIVWPEGADRLIVEYMPAEHPPFLINRQRYPYGDVGVQDPTPVFPQADKALIEAGWELVE